MNQSSSGYGLSDVGTSPSIDAPRLDYLPHLPSECHLPIGLVGAGGISEYHLRAYRRLGLDVVAICDLDASRAEARRLEFYPQAKVETDYRKLIARTDVAVVDVATHVEERIPIVEAALLAGKHVLSQKPLVTDLNEGRRLADLADRHGVRFAVNQNGRWAPQFSYLRQAVATGLIGPLASLDFSLQWDHTWTATTAFNDMRHLILCDFGIHWFDIITTLMGDAVPERVFASVRHASFQRAKPPFLAHVVIDYPHAQARLNFNAHTQWGQEDRTVVVGQTGTIRAWGPSLNDQQLAIWSEAGWGQVPLAGCWFDNGFQGTMCELLVSIHDQREPSHGASDNLRSLQLCFAAMLSADRGEPISPATIERWDGPL